MKQEPNAYTQPLHRFSSAEESEPTFQLADALYKAAEEERYKELSETEMHQLLAQAQALLTEDGLTPLLVDEMMPSDCRVDLYYHPTYAIAAAAMYARQTMPQLFRPEEDALLTKLLHGCTLRGLRGHGIDAGKEQRRNLLLFSKAGARDFCVAHRELCPEFVDLVQSTIRMFERDLQKAKEDNTTLVEMVMWEQPIVAGLEQVVAAYHGKTHTLFVYGTLMQGQRANDLLWKGWFSRRYILKDHALVDLGAYPAVIPQEKASVLGEVWFVDEATLAELDRYEDEGSLYARRPVRVTSEQGALRAEAYVYLQETDELEQRECWDRQPDDEVWYACYGSNLSAERFRCYVQGGTAANGRTYRGCWDKTLWREDYAADYAGRLYFGNQSASWENGGVAFYDPNGHERVFFRLYRITRAQLADIRAQEGDSPNWYGNTILLGLGKDNLPVYTLTSTTLRPQNLPSERYLNLIRTALQEMGCRQKDAERYLKKAQKPIKRPAKG